MSHPIDNYASFLPSKIDIQPVKNVSYLKTHAISAISKQPSENGSISSKFKNIESERKSNIRGPTLGEEYSRFSDSLKIRRTTFGKDQDSDNDSSTHKNNINGVFNYGDNDLLKNKRSTLGLQENAEQVDET